MADDIVEFCTRNASPKNETGSYAKRLLEESKVKLLKQFDDEKRANLNMSRMDKQMKKQF